MTPTLQWHSQLCSPDVIIPKVVVIRRKAKGICVGSRWCDAAAVSTCEQGQATLRCLAILGVVGGRHMLKLLTSIHSLLLLWSWFSPSHQSQFNFLSGILCCARCRAVPPVQAVQFCTPRLPAASTFPHHHPETAAH
jgi:hypothetical protein